MLDYFDWLGHTGHLTPEETGNKRAPYNKPANIIQSMKLKLLII